MLNTKTKIGLARLAYLMVRTARSIIGQSGRGVFARGGIRWALDLNEGIDFSIFLLGAFEPRTLRAYRALIQRGDTVLDIGANVGAHTLFFAQMVGNEGRVIAFEPTEFAYRKLEDNLALNPELAAIVDARHMLLVDADGGPPPHRIFSSWPLTGGRDLHPKHLGQAQALGTVESVTLDEFVGRQSGLSPTWIKIDVDGNEYPVIMGGAETIRRFRPRIIMELSPYTSREAGYDFAKLIEFFVELGYSFRNLENGHSLPAQARALEQAVPDGGGINMLLSPH
jgi:FkbM family methyltransferase